MPSMIRQTSIAANATNPNIFTGSTFEYARVRQVVSLGVTAAATGLFCVFNVGADVVGEEFEPPIETVYPIIPDRYYLQDVAEMGDRYVLSVRNSTAGAIIARAIAILTNV
jgi:hypothetical protein